MKPSLKIFRPALLLSLIMMIVSGLHSQTGDTSRVWIPRTDALRVLSQADSAMVYKQILLQKQSDIDLLNERIDGLTKVIAAYDIKDANNKAIIQQMNDQRKILEDQRDMLLDTVASLNKKLRKEKRKRKWLAFLGLVGLGSAFWLGTNL